MQTLFNEQGCGGVVSKCGLIELFFQCLPLASARDPLQRFVKILPRFVCLKSGAILKEVMTNGVELLVIEMVARILAAKGEKLIDQVRHGEQGWTPIESIPFVFKGTHFATGVLACFKNIHGIPLLGQTNGCGDARDSCSNNDGFFRHKNRTTQ